MTRHIHFWDNGTVEPPHEEGCVNPVDYPAVAYLGGPMRGIAHANFPALDAATAELRAAGWTIFSPAENDREMGLTGGQVLTKGEGASLLAWDFQRIIEASLVIFLPGWERSTGSHWEMTVAYATDKPCFEYHGPDDLRRIELPAVVTQPTKCGLRFEATKVAEAPVEAPIPYSDRDLLTGTARWVEPASFEQDHEDSVTSPTDADVDRWVATAEEEEAWAEIEALEASRAALAAEADRIAVPVQPGDWKAVGFRVQRPDAFDVALEARVVDPETGGAKGQKAARFDLLPWDVLYELAEHFGRGSRKYEDRNWERGYAWGLSLGALGRHLAQWAAGEDTDPETGSSHLIAVAWHAMALRWFQLHGKGSDDRSYG